MHPLLFLATDRDREHRAAADQLALAKRVRAARAARRSPWRRHLAIALAVVSRSSAAAVRRLDACLGEELAGRTASAR
jgi:hypothetical protein